MSPEELTMWYFIICVTTYFGGITIVAIGMAMTQSEKFVNSQDFAISAINWPFLIIYYIMFGVYKLLFPLCKLGKIIGLKLRCNYIEICDKI